MLLDRKTLQKLMQLSQFLQICKNQYEKLKIILIVRLVASKRYGPAPQTVVEIAEVLP